MRKILFLLLPFLIFSPAWATENLPKNSFTVTSVEKCYAELSPEEALDVQRNYIKPYQECRKRLELKKKEESKKTPQDAIRETPPPTNYYRVQRTTLAPQKPPEEEKAPAATPGAYTQEKIQLE